MRFILVCFAFLAFVFYEMSGGGDFDPEATRLARIDAPIEVKHAALEAPTALQTPRRLPQDVTRVALSLTSVNDVLRPSNLRTTAARATEPFGPPAPSEGVSEEAPTIILPSLISNSAVITPVEFGRDSDEQPTSASIASGNFDVRSVSGNSVNVRGGPGTNHAVVSRLRRGDKVEILADPGNGWVQLRPVNGGAVGWMADFLLSDS